MLQLSGLDTAFLNMETDATFGHVSQLMLFEADGFHGGRPLEAVRAHFAARIYAHAPFCRRLVEVPMGLDRPYWIDVGEVDLEFHVRHIGVPPPGEDTQLADQIAWIIERPMDRSRPLWELYVIEGLANGQVALLLKLHHATIDGQSGMAMFRSLLDDRPDAPAPPPAPPPATEAEPENWELFARAWFAMLRSPARALSQQWNGLRAGANLLGSRAAAPAAEALGQAWEDAWSRWWSGDAFDALAVPAVTAPATPLNGSISAHRRVAFLETSLDTLKAIRRAADCTLNDVVMTVCGGALRRYLQRHDALPDRPLIAMVPVSVRTGEETETYSNQVSAMLGELATDEPDPAKRLARVSRAMQSAKELHNAIPARLLQDFSRFASPAVAAQAARTVARLRLADRMAPVCNVVISNVPGPRERLYLAGAELAALIPVSTVGEGLALNMTVVSYRDRLDFGYVACRERVPDLWALMDDTRAAIDELAAAFPG